MPSAPVVEFVDIKKKAQTDKRFRRAVAVFLEDENRLLVDLHLPERTNGTRGLAIAHELAHARMRRSGARDHLSTTQEEWYCELEAVFATPDAALSHAEEIVKRILLPGRHWRNRRDRKQIRSKILRMLGVAWPDHVAALLAKAD